MLTRSRDYQVSGISGEAIASGDGDENTIYNTLRGEMEGSMRNLTAPFRFTPGAMAGGSADS